MTTASFHPRRLGEFLLVAQLSEDALGTVYRAVHESDEGRFLRLRILQSPELFPRDVREAVERNAERISRLSHKNIVQRERLGVTDGIPFLAWHEPAGWTLDFVLAKLRADKQRIPLVWGLLMAQHVAAALEHAWFSVVDGEPTRHGLLWPGFVSISPDAEIRVGGFGLAEAVLPALHRPRLAREIAPYLPPESRTTGVSGEDSDVYSLGILLEEIATGRRPRATPDLTELPSEDALAEKVKAVLQRALAPPAERFASPAEFNRAVQEKLAENPTPISSSEFALFLYELLNPESRSVTAALDAESTNPLRAEEPKESTTPVAPSATVHSPPAVKSRSVSQRRKRRAALAAAAAVVVVMIVAGLTTVLRPGSPGAETSVPAAASPKTAPAMAALPPAPPSLESRPTGPAGTLVARRAKKARASFRLERSASRAVLRETLEARSAAEKARLGAGLARVAAERLDAPELATDAFSAARDRERAGEASLRSGHPSAAQSEFGRAAGLFQEAEKLARQERVRRVKLSGEQSE